jgi:hypothetical protein
MHKNLGIFYLQSSEKKLDKRFSLKTKYLLDEVRDSLHKKRNLMFYNLENIQNLNEFSWN